VCCLVACDVAGDRGSVAADTPKEARGHGVQERQADEIEARLAMHDASLMLGVTVDENG
jgi:hypothetical protein